MNQFNGGFATINNIINRNDLFCWMIDCHSQEVKYHQVAVETLASMLHQLGLAQTIFKPKCWRQAILTMQLVAFRKASPSRDGGYTLIQGDITQLQA